MAQSAMAQTISRQTMNQRAELIFYSGGNLRDALRLLRLCCESVAQLPINGQTVEEAAYQLAAEFRGWLTVEQYGALAECDLNPNMGQGEIINQ